MTSEATRRPMRSWLFAPGDSERKIGKCIASDADMAILDLEDAVAPEAKPEARRLVHDVLRDVEGDRGRVFVRVNPLDGPHTLDDLVAVMPARPGGIMLPKIYGSEDLETLDKYLDALEVANGIAKGSTPVLAIATETARSVLHCAEIAAGPRVIGLTWGAEDLADALGASVNTQDDGSYGFTYEMARSMCLLGAAGAGVPAFDTIQGDFRDLDRLRLRAEKMRRDGFGGMLAIHPAQVDVINRAFTPSEEELAEAREIVALFDANPGTGAIGWKGGMLDRPHLARAQNLLASAGE